MYIFISLVYSNCKNTDTYIKCVICEQTVK